MGCGHGLKVECRERSGKVGGQGRGEILIDGGRTVGDTDGIVKSSNVALRRHVRYSDFSWTSTSEIMEESGRLSEKTGSAMTFSGLKYFHPRIFFAAAG